MRIIVTPKKEFTHIVLPPVRGRATSYRSKGSRKHLNPLSKVDMKCISNIMHIHCSTHCKLVYGQGTCLGMECYKAIQKVDGELDLD